MQTQPPRFNRAAAKAAGYTDEEIDAYLAREQAAAPVQEAPASQPAVQPATQPQEQPKQEEGTFRSLARKAGETLYDVGLAGLSNIPGAATVAGAVNLARGQAPSVKAGAQQFQAEVEAARERSGVVAGKYSPAALAGGAVPYALPFGQATRLARAGYSALVGGAREGEKAALEDAEAGDIAKRTALGAALESAIGYALGEPAGASMRAMRTPARATQIATQREATRRAETPLYEAWTGYTGRGSPVTQPPLSPVTPKLGEALSDPTVQRAIGKVYQNPEFRNLPPTSPVILDRAYKEIGSRAFKQEYSVGTETAKNVRDLLREGMDEAKPGSLYSDVLEVASKGRKVGEAIGKGAETARVASQASPGTLATALKKGEQTFAEYLKTATPEQRAAAAEGVYGYLREAPKTAGIPLGMRARVPVPIIPSRAAWQAPRIAQMTGDRPTLLQRTVRGGVAGAPGVFGVPSGLYDLFGIFE